MMRKESDPAPTTMVAWMSNVLLWPPITGSGPSKLQLKSIAASAGAENNEIATTIAADMTNERTRSIILTPPHGARMGDIRQYPGQPNAHQFTSIDTWSTK